MTASLIVSAIQSLGSGANKGGPTQAMPGSKYQSSIVAT